MIEELKHETFERYNVVFLFYNENDSYVIETESLNQIDIKYKRGLIQILDDTYLFYFAQDFYFLIENILDLVLSTYYLFQAIQLLY